MRFAPGIDIITYLERILRYFEILDFLEFFICGFTKNRTRRNFYGLRNFEIILEIA